MVQTSNKRLSLEGAKPSNAPANPEPPQESFTPSHPNRNPQQSSEPPPSEDNYVGQHVDVTEEVNRRLRESRLRRLMDSPSTSQKRKRGAFEDMNVDNTGDVEDEEDENADIRRTPTKKLRASGSFEPALKRKETGLVHGDYDEHDSQPSNFKRRRVWRNTA